MVKLAGSVLVFMGFIHAVVGLFLFSDQLHSIWMLGAGRGTQWGFEELAAFWFMIFAWLMVTTGILIRPLSDNAEGKFALMFVAASLIAVPIVTGVFLPLSGLWLMMVPGGMMLLVLIRGRRNVRPN